MRLLFGLSEATLEKLRGVFAKNQKIAKAIIYGSRAKGNYQPGSDIDLCLFARHAEEISTHDLADLLDEIDELLLPYTVDLSAFESLENTQLREHIERVGQVFYQHGSAGGDLGEAMAKV